MVVAGGLTQFLTEVFGDLSGLDTVFDPELTDCGIVMGQSEAVSGQRMREIGGVEVQTKVVCLCPFYPGSKMLGSNFVSFYLLAFRIQINGVESQLLLTGNQFVCEFKVFSQFSDGACLAGIVARCLYSAS